MPFAQAEIVTKTDDEKKSILFAEELRLIRPLVCENGCLDKNGDIWLMKVEKKSATKWQAVCNRCVYNKQPEGKRSIREKSWFQGTKLPFQTMIRFIYAWSRNWATVAYCMEELGMSKGAIVEWCGCLREVCAWRIRWKDEEAIGGPGRTVEIDETLFSRRKHHAGRILLAKWVFGGICREDKTRRFAVCVPDRTAAVLLPIIRKWIRPGTRIISDGWSAYKQLGNDPDYVWSWVNHKTNFVNPDDETVHTQTIVSMWRPLKEARSRRNGNRVELNDSYLTEGLWRMWVKQSGLDSFDAIIHDIADCWKPGNDKPERFPDEDPNIADALKDDNDQ